MSGKTLISGTAYTINGGRTSIGGAGYSIKSAKTLIDGTGRTISFGTPVGSLAVGSSLFMNYGGEKTEFLIVHQGLPSSIYDSSCNGTWVLFKDLIGQNQEWGEEDEENPENSTLIKSLNSTWILDFDTKIQNAIKSVKVPYHTGPNGTLKTGANGLSCKMFLLSAIEFGFPAGNSPSTTMVIPSDGVKLDYFESGYTASAQNKRIGYWGPTPWTYWTRFPDTRWGSVWCVYSNGGVTTNNASTGYGTRPAFVLPSDTLIDGTYISLS